MIYNKRQLSKEAKSMHFVRDTYEKVLRLLDVLKMMQEQEPFHTCLALKGGTAINLTMFDLPRLSVDIDLDYHGDESKELVMENRAIINEKLKLFMKSEGYNLSNKSKFHYLMDSFVYSYVNSGGQMDNIKIEINYSLRCHLFLPEYRSIQRLPSNFLVKTLHPMDIFAGKINALISRCKPRDMYDFHQMIIRDMFCEEEKILLRKCAVFYRAISSDGEIEFDLKKMKDIQQVHVKKHLLPVIHNAEFVDIDIIKEVIEEYYECYMKLDTNDQKFLKLFQQGCFQPELLFDEKIQSRIQHHPMVEWKLQHKS